MTTYPYRPCVACSQTRHHSCSGECNCSCEQGKFKGTLAFDFDGTIFGYSKGWHDGTLYEGPILGAFDTLQKYYDLGYSLVIFSCRDQPRETRLWFERWRKGYTFQIADITREKPVAIAYIDDRGVGFRGDWAAAEIEIDAILAMEEGQRAQALDTVATRD